MVSVLKRRCFERGVTTPEQFVVVFEARAAALSLPGESVSTRTVERWWSGHSERPRNASRLILEAEFGETVDDLLSPDDGAGRDGEDRARLDLMLSLARMGRHRGWWETMAEIRRHAYLGYEADATSIRVFEHAVIPGIFQTPEYADAVFAAARPPFAPEERQRRVAERMARKHILKAPKAPTYWAIVSEAALRFLVGGPDVMRAQLSYLTEIARLPNVELQLLPFSVGAHPAMASGFQIFVLSDPVEPPVVFVEASSDGSYLDTPAGVEAFEAKWHELRALALGRPESTALIERTIATLPKE